MASASTARTTARLKAFDLQQRRDSRVDHNPQLGFFPLTNPAPETIPKVIVKKHAGAVHSHSQLSCLERKLVNVCLYLAYDELGDKSKQVHSAPISQISTLVGFDSSKNTAHLKAAFRSLVTSIVEWSIINERGAETWEACSVLSGVRFRNGICEFEFPWILREKLYMPERYARLELGQMRNLSTVAAVALGEHLVRYENMGQTPTLDVKLWRALLGAEAATYNDFRRFNEKIIRPAVEQVNEHMHLTTEPEFIRQDRRVVAMRFSIHGKGTSKVAAANAPANGAQEQAPEVSAVARRLSEEMLLTQTQIENVLRDYDEARIVTVLDYVGRRYLEGKVTSSLAAYFLSTLPNFETTVPTSALDQRRQDSEKSKRASEDAAKRMQGYRDAFASVWRARAQQVLDDMSQDEREVVLEEFHAHLQATQNASLSQWQGTGGPLSPAIAALLRNFIAERFLPSRAEAFTEWVAAQEAVHAAA